MAVNSNNQMYSLHVHLARYFVGYMIVFPKNANGFATILSFLHSMISQVRWEMPVHQTLTCHEINSLDSPKRAGGI